MLTLKEQEELSKRHKQFVDLVYNMRAEQIAFFKSRNSLRLEAAKKLEKKVDAFLDSEANIRKTQAQQGHIF